MTVGEDSIQYRKRKKKSAILYFIGYNEMASLSRSVGSHFFLIQHKWLILK